MTFFTEPTGYEKTILSDLQGAWQGLRQDIVDHAGFPGWERMLLHVDEAMSWETVRYLPRMRPLLLLIRNLAIQNQAPAGVLEDIEEVSDILDEVLSPGTAD
jgi:hypothetical protein